MDKKEVPEIPGGDVPGGDSMAAKEEAAFRAANYAKISEKNEHTRSETVRWLLHWAAVLIFLEFVAIYVILLAVWAHDLVASDAKDWLDSATFDKVQAIVLSGIVASSLSKYYDRYMK